MLENLSIVIVTYNNEEHIEKCLDSLPLYVEIIIVDNASSDRTIKIIEDKYPHINIIKSKKNLGYGKGVNLGVKNSNMEYVIILNPDTIIQGNSIEELIKPIVDKKDVITTPKVMLYDGSGINTCGNIEHFTGLTFTLGLGEDKEELTDASFISGLSGVCFAIKRNLYLEIGGFDEAIFLYMEDAELSWNINSRGLKILYVPTAIIYHDYELTVPAEKIYHLERGRYTILKKYFTWREYLIFAPSLIVAELFTGGYALLKGSSGLKFKMQAMKDGLKADVNKIDCNKRELINSFEWKVPEEQLSHNFLDKFIKKCGNIVFFVNYNLMLMLWNLKIQNSEIPEINAQKEIQSK